MIELLKGRISDADGLKEVLEIIATFKEVGTAVLNVESEEASGRIGVAWGKFLTGALINDSEETGKKALRKLLGLRAGKFVFFDLDDEDAPIVELRQQLGIDLIRAATVIPELDPKEAHFLYDADELESPKSAEPIIATEPEPEPEFVLPIPAVAELPMDEPLPMPEATEEDYAQVTGVPAVAAAEPEYATPLLDAVFGGTAVESAPPFVETSIEISVPRSLEDSFSMQPDFSEHTEPVDTFEMRPEPVIAAMPLSGAPMLQPNVVADKTFIGQQFVDPPGRLRPEPATDSSSIGIAIICVLLFVVSCAGTVILGPRAWELIASTLHM